MKEISVQELQEMMNNEEDFQLVDVREPNEYDFCNIGGELIPLGTVLDHQDQIARDKKVVVHCKSGRRSASAIQALEAEGFDNLYNLRGGILAWAQEIDDSVPTY